jgi:hypothetical protein
MLKWMGLGGNVTAYLLKKKLVLPIPNRMKDKNKKWKHAHLIQGPHRSVKRKLASLSQVRP